LNLEKRVCGFLRFFTEGVAVSTARRLGWKAHHHFYHLRPTHIAVMSGSNLGLDLKGLRDSDSLANKNRTKSTMDILSRAAQSPRSSSRSVEHRIPKTKIVCTIGPNTNNKDTMIKMMEAGMSVTRMNFSHGDHKVRGPKILAPKPLQTGREIFFAISQRHFHLHTAVAFSTAVSIS
jgi:hypothetical protein